MCIIIIINNNKNSNNKNNNENTIAKAKICHSFNYFHLINLYFYLNRWHYRVFLIQLLRVLSLQKLQFYSHKMILKKKQNLVKSHSLTSNWITKKMNFLSGIGISKYLNMHKSRYKLPKRKTNVKWQLNQQ